MTAEIDARCGSSRATIALQHKRYSGNLNQNRRFENTARKNNAAAARSIAANRRYPLCLSVPLWAQTITDTHTDTKTHTHTRSLSSTKKNTDLCSHTRAARQVLNCTRKILGKNIAKSAAVKPSLASRQRMPAVEEPENQLDSVHFCATTKKTHKRLCCTS